MSRFRVVITGSGMSIPPDGAEGFATTRFVQAPSPARAAETALRLVQEAVAAEAAFRTSPAPQLAVELVTRVWSPFRASKPNGGYSFWASAEDREDAVEIERKAGAGWW
jgi:hypothetical protein